MIGKNSVVKNAENFYERNVKDFVWKFLIVLRNLKKPEMILLSGY